MIPAFYHPDFAAPIGDHRMPIRKFGLVAEAVRALPGVEIRSPSPATQEDLLRVHTALYRRAIEEGEPRTLAESQKFPWNPGLYPSVCLTNGGVIAAAQAALSEATHVSAAIASGFHHSFADHGEGFCTFNGLIVAAEKLRAEGKLQHVSILDLDLHYGNGTASLVQNRPWIQALSIYGNDYANNIPFRDVRRRRHEDGDNHHSIPLSAGTGWGGLLEALKAGFEWLDQRPKPDLLLFQAGADPYKEDPYSPLSLEIDDLFQRDRWVFQNAHLRSWPVAWVLAGGYTEDISKIVSIHRNTFIAALEIYANAP